MQNLLPTKGSVYIHVFTLSTTLGLMNVPFQITYMSLEERLFKSFDDSRLLKMNLEKFKI